MIQKERRRQLATMIVSRRVSVSGPEIEDFRRRRQAEGRMVEEALLAQILIRSPVNERDTALGREQFKRAVEIAREAGRDPSAFSLLASEKSDDPAGRELGGILGWIDPEKLIEPLRDRVATLRVNEISEPIACDDGYHILLLLGRHGSRELLMAEKFDRERVKLLDQLRDDAKIEIYPPTISQP